MTTDLLAQLPMQVSAEAIETFCQKWGISELSLFGSVLRDDFTPDSDVDVLISFPPHHRYTLWNLMDMGDELEAIFGRKVDLGVRAAVENDPNYLRRKYILNGAKVLYGT